jgi:hypothetical protein
MRSKLIKSHRQPASALELRLIKRIEVEARTQLQTKTKLVLELKVEDEDEVELELKEIVDDRCWKLKVDREMR